MIKNSNFNFSGYKHQKAGLRIIIITQGISGIIWPLLNSNHQVIAILESAPRNYQHKRHFHHGYALVCHVLSVVKPHFQSLKQLCKQKKYLIIL